jgi:uncharacterized protein (TIGR03083 family)
VLAGSVAPAMPATDAVRTSAVPQVQALDASDTVRAMTAVCHRADHAHYVELVRAEIGRLAQVVANADPAARVPTCPDWSVQQLAEHVGGVHRWAEHHVRTLSPVRVPGRDVSLETPEDPKELPAWLDRGADLLAETLRAADPDAPVWGWGSDKHVRFWSRRMLHETTVHRADAEIALGHAPETEDDVAIDGVDEYLDNLPHAVFFAPRVAELRGSGEAVGLRCEQAGWTVTLEPDAFRWNHADGEATATVAVEATPTELLLFSYGRIKADALEVTGDGALLDFWVERSSI